MKLRVISVAVLLLLCCLVPRACGTEYGNLAITIYVNGVPVSARVIIECSNLGYYEEVDVSPPYPFILSVPAGSFYVVDAYPDVFDVQRIHWGLVTVEPARTANLYFGYTPPDNGDEGPPPVVDPSATLLWFEGVMITLYGWWWLLLLLILLLIVLVWLLKQRDKKRKHAVRM